VNGLQESLLVFNVNDPEKYSYAAADTSKLYCYDVSIPPTGYTNVNVSKYLREDLRRAFDIQVKKEKKSVLCLVLRSTSSISNAYTKHLASEEMDTQAVKKYMHNNSLKEIISRLSIYLDRPVIDETGITQNIDIDFPDKFDLSDQQGIIETLRKAGFEVKEEYREMEVVVITDRI
jgi:uncharacterized protein (TIGR03435 family)